MIWKVLTNILRGAVLVNKTVTAVGAATDDGRPLTRGMLRSRFCGARESCDNGNDALSTRIRSFQFRDARAKAASEITNLAAASQLLGHTEQEITEKVYRRVGQKVMPTR